MHDYFGHAFHICNETAKTLGQNGGPWSNLNQRRGL